MGRASPRCSRSSPARWRRQDLVQRADVTVADLLGISERLAALRRIEAGSIDLSDYDTLGDDWDIEACALAVIAQRAPGVSFEGVLDRSTLALSGGEVLQLGLASVELDGAPIALLDEPTNNLDAAARDARTRRSRRGRVSSSS